MHAQKIFEIARYIRFCNRKENMLLFATTY